MYEILIGQNFDERVIYICMHTYLVLFGIAVFSKLVYIWSSSYYFVFED